MQTNPIKKTIIVKKSPINTEIRRCLNCGKDISSMHAKAKFCCPVCREAYNYDSETYTKNKQRKDEYSFRERSI